MTLPGNEIPIWLSLTITLLVCGSLMLLTFWPEICGFFSTLKISFNDGIIKFYKK